jgi:hypothetical protein
MGESAWDEAQWLISALSLWELHSCGSCECLEPWLERQKRTKMGIHYTNRNFLKCRCLKCHRIVHLNLICTSYDQKKGRKSTWEFDSRPQIPWKKASNEVQSGRVIHLWKDIFERYKILPSHFQNIFDLRKIWMSKFLGQQESQFWDSHLRVSGKSDIWM